MGKRVDWEHWRGLYVAGDDSVTFQSLSELDGAPAFSTIRNKACPPKDSNEPSWADLRKQYRKELAKESVGGDRVSLSVEDAIARTDKIIDTAEMLTQHNAIAKALIGIGAAGIKEFQLNNFAKAKQMKPRELLEFAKFGIEMQRIIEGMATSKTEIDFKGMSDAELNAIIDGDT